MGRKIFVSYKYADSDVRSMAQGLLAPTTTVRDYVTKFEEFLDSTDHIYKGEHDNEDLSQFKDETIESHLKQKIRDSSITVVFISKGMYGWPEDEQWIPWEVSYSLKEIQRNGVVSRTNALLAVVIPDRSRSYNYFISEHTCPYCDCVIYNTASLFGILRNNTFNAKSLVEADCDHYHSSKIYTGEPSYMPMIKWDEFVRDVDGALEMVSELRERQDDFNICKVI